MTTVQIVYRGAAKQFDVPLQILYSTLLTKTKNTFSLDAVKFLYVDADGDTITFSTQQELTELCAEYESRLLTLYVNEVTEIRQDAFHQHQPAVTSSKTVFEAQSSFEASSSQSASEEASSSASSSKSASESDSASASASASSSVPPPNLDTLLESASGVFERVQEVLMQNPQLVDEARGVASQFFQFLQQQQEQQQQQQQQQQYFGCGPAFAQHPFAQHPFAAFFQSQGCGSPFQQSECCPQEAPSQQKPQETSQEAPAQQKPQEVPRSDFPDRMQQLFDMGFIDAQLNAQLLSKHLGNVHRVVAELSDLMVF